MIAIALEATERRLKFEEAMNGLRLASRRLAETLGSAAGRGTQRTAQSLGRENLEDASDQRRLADARPARDDQDLLRGRLPDGLALCVRQLEAHLLFHPCQGRRQID